MQPYKIKADEMFSAMNYQTWANFKLIFMVEWTKYALVAAWKVGKIHLNILNTTVGFEEWLAEIQHSCGVV